MALTNAFQEAVSEGNVRKIRIMLKDSLLVDPSFERFREMERAAASVEGLYDAHDGRAFVKNPEEWDDSYMDKIMVQVVGNFSHERIKHLMDVVRKLRPIPKKSVENARQNTSGYSSRHDEKTTSSYSYQQQKRTDQLNGDYRGAKIAAGAVVGGIVGGAVGAMASLAGPAVAGCVVGAAVGAATVYYSGERK